MHALLIFALSFCALDPGPVVPEETLQLVVGLTDRWNSRSAMLYRFERVGGGAWERVDGPWRANIGKKGLAAGRGLLEWCGSDKERKVEGDKKAPAGAFLIGEKYGFDEGLKSAPEGRIIPLTATMACVSDSASAVYNRIVDTETTQRDWNWTRPLRKADKIMSRVIMIGLNGGADPDNDDPLPTQGSCILFHVARGEKPTVGCTSLPEDEIDALMGWLEPESNPVYILMTRDQYRALSTAPNSGLPETP